MNEIYRALNIISVFLIYIKKKKEQFLNSGCKLARKTLT